jgi:integrase
MPKSRKNQLIHCVHFVWRLTCRNACWYADGRSNVVDAGRHSLGTKDREKAMQRLPELDRSRAETLGLIPRSKAVDARPAPMPLSEGRKLYEEHLSRPRSIGGTKPSTRKRYRTVFDKFLAFAHSKGVLDWREVDTQLITRYAGHLEQMGRKPKTQRNELVVLIQTLKWLIEAGHLAGHDPVRIKFLKVESQRAYCWRPEEVKAIIDFCQADLSLRWLADVAVALACTGTRISELAAMRWGDLNLESGMLSLPDESGYAVQDGLEQRDRKTGRTRSFPIHQDLVPVLLRQKHLDSYVFHGPRGGRLKPDTVRNVLVKKVIPKLADRFPCAEGSRGFRAGRLHSFRHFFCSLCANSNVPIMIVMEWLGHQDSAMVRHYYHLHDIESRRQMERLNPLGTSPKDTA